MARNRSGSAFDNAFNQGYRDGVAGRPLDFWSARQQNPNSSAYVSGWRAGTTAYPKAHGGKKSPNADTFAPGVDITKKSFSQTPIGSGADAGGAGGGVGGLTGVGGVQSDLNAVGGVANAINGVGDFLKFIGWLFHPLNILRTVEFIAGMVFFSMGLRATFNLNRGGGPGSEVRRVARELASATPVGSAQRRAYGRRQGRREGQVEQARLTARKESRQREASREQKRGQKRRPNTP